VDLPPMRLGYPRTELRRKLVDSVLRGAKTATAGLRAECKPHADEPLPRVGARCVLLGFDDEPVAVVETMKVRVVRAADVDLAFALDEGEGFETVSDGRHAHGVLGRSRDRRRHTDRRRAVQSRRTSLALRPEGRKGVSGRLGPV
jgi:ASCH domain